MRTGFIAKAVIAQSLLVFCTGSGWASPCIAPPLSTEAISQFKSNPQAIIAPGSDARTIEAVVRDLAGTDPSLASDLVGLAKATTPRFQIAIAAGLAQAATACTNIDQQAGLFIQQAVAGFQNGEFQDAFAAVAGDLSTAATEAAGASAIGSAGSVTITNPNVSPGLPKSPSGGGTNSFFQITSAGIALTNNSAPGTTTTTTTAADQISATR